MTCILQSSLFFPILLFFLTPFLLLRGVEGTMGVCLSFSGSVLVLVFVTAAAGLPTTTDSRRFIYCFGTLSEEQCIGPTSDEEDNWRGKIYLRKKSENASVEMKVSASCKSSKEDPFEFTLEAADMEEGWQQLSFKSVMLREGENIDPTPVWMVQTGNFTKLFKLNTSNQAHLTIVNPEDLDIQHFKVEHCREIFKDLRAMPYLQQDSSTIWGQVVACLLGILILAILIYIVKLIRDIREEKLNWKKGEELTGTANNPQDAERSHQMCRGSRTSRFTTPSERKRSTMSCGHPLQAHNYPDHSTAVEGGMSYPPLLPPPPPLATLGESHPTLEMSANTTKQSLPNILLSDYGNPIEPRPMTMPLQTDENDYDYIDFKSLGNTPNKASLPITNNNSNITPQLGNLSTHESLNSLYTDIKLIEVQRPEIMKSLALDDRGTLDVGKSNETADVQGLDKECVQNEDVLCSEECDEYANLLLSKECCENADALGSDEGIYEKVNALDFKESEENTSTLRLDETCNKNANTLGSEEYGENVNALSSQECKENAHALGSEEEYNETLNTPASEECNENAGVLGLKEECDESSDAPSSGEHNENTDGSSLQIKCDESSDASTSEGCDESTNKSSPDRSVENISASVSAQDNETTYRSSLKQSYDKTNASSINEEKRDVNASTVVSEENHDELMKTPASKDK